MNADDFEKQLQQHPLRKAPDHWRAQILSAARQSECRAKNPEQEKVTWLYRLFWPNPAAWGALAAIWVVVFALNFADRDQEPEIASSAVPSRETLIALKQQRQLRAELISAANEVPVAEPPKFSAPQSRNNPTVQITLV